MNRTPILPRRAILASILSAGLAGAGLMLSIWGGVSRVRHDSFAFFRGEQFAQGEEERLGGLLAQALSDERLFVTIIGHAGTVGDSMMNVKMSSIRAEKVAGIAKEIGIPDSRMKVASVGGAQPLPKKEGESDRAYQSRLARVEIFLQVRK
jgi:hypothetical protein